MFPRPLQVMTLTASHSFQLGSHGACRDAVIVLHPHTVPSLKFVRLPVPNMWLIFGHGVKRPDDLDL